MNVLVLTDKTHNTTTRIINKMKLLPLVCNTILSASDMLKHHSIDAIVIDRNHEHVDSLEFVLNMREFNSTIPIYLIENRISDDLILKILRPQLGVETIPEDELPRRLKSVLRQN